MKNLLFLLLLQPFLIQAQMKILVPQLEILETKTVIYKAYKNQFWAIDKKAKKEIWRKKVFTSKQFVTHLSTTKNNNEILVIEHKDYILCYDVAKQSKIQEINLTQFEGKTIGELIQQKGLKSYNSITYKDEPPGKLRSITLLYGNASIIIYPIEKNKQPVQFKIDRKFDLESLKKETINIIEYTTF